MRVGRPGPRAGKGGVRASRLWLLASLAGLLVVGSCVEELDLLEGELPALVRVDFVVDPEPELAVTARDLPLHWLRLSVTDAETGEGVATGSIELDPDSVPDRWQLRLEVPSTWETTLEGTVELVRALEGEEGGESVEWSVVVEPTTVTAEQENWEIHLPFGRGSLEELGVTGVGVGEPEGPVLEGETFGLAATVEGGPEEGARVFWGSEDPEVAEVDATGFVSTLLPGQTRIIAAAGLRWAAAEVQVLQRVDSVVVEPGQVALSTILDEATFNAVPLDPRGAPVTDRELPVAWSVEDETVAEYLGNGVFLAVGEGETEVIALVEGVEGRATLTVEIEPGGVFEGDLTIQTQADLDAFAANGWEEVTGSLTIGGEGSLITSLTGLETLRRVGGAVRIRDVETLENLDAFSGLTSTIQDLQIDNNASLTSIQGLQNLGSSTEAFPAVLGDFTVTDNAALPTSQAVALSEDLGVAGTVTISGNLDDSGEPVFEGDLTVFDEADLADFAANGWVEVTGTLTVGGEGSSLSELSGMGTLRRVGGDLIVADNSALVDLAGLGELEEAGGSFRIVGNASLSSLPEFASLSSLGMGFEFGGLVITGNDSLEGMGGFPALEESLGDVIVASNPALLQIPEFPVLTTTGVRSLFIQDNEALTGIGGFPELMTIGGSLQIQDNAGLMSVGEFTALGSVGPFIRVWDNPSLETVGGFPGLVSVGTLDFRRNQALAAIPEFPALTSVSGGLILAFHDMLETIGGFPVLESVGNVLRIEDSPVLTGIPGFPALVGIGASVLFSRNPEVGSIGGFPLLEATGLNLQLWETGTFTALDFLPALVSVGQHVRIIGNPNLENLDGLSGMTSTVQDLWVSENASLTDIQGLQNIGSAEEAFPAVLGDFTVTDNAALPTSQAQSMAEALGVAGTVTISGNLDDSGEPVFEGDLTVFDEADLADFAANGWVEVNGNLTVGGEGSPLIDLEGMETLRGVTGDLFVVGNPSLVDLSALSGLEGVGGEFRIQENPSLETLSVFPVLESIGSHLRIEMNELLTAVPEFPVLTSVGGNLAIWNNSGVASLGGFPVLGSTGEDLLIENNDVLTSIPEFPGLTSVGWRLRINNNPSLETLGGLPVLEGTGSDLWIRNNGSLAAIPELQSLATVGWSVSIWNNPVLETLGGFPALETVGQDLHFQGNPMVGSLGAFSSLATVGGELLIQGNDALEELGGLSGVTSTVQGLLIRGNGSLTDISGLSNIGSAEEAFPAVLGDFTVTDNPSLPQADAVALADALGVEGTVTISGNQEEAEPETIEWTTEGEAAWDDPANWSLGRIPMPGDTVVIVPEGSTTVTLGGLEVSVGRLILGGEASAATLSLTDSDLALTESLWIGPQAALEAHGESFLRVQGMLNEGTLLAEGNLFFQGTGTEPELVNAFSGSVLAGSVGLIQLSLPAGGVFTTSGTVQGDGVESSVTFSGGTINYEDGTLDGGDALVILNATLNLTPDLTGEEREYFLQNTVVNGPGGIDVLQFSTLSLSASLINTWIRNEEGEVLVIDGDTEVTGGLVNGGFGRLVVFGVSGTTGTSLTVNESDGFFNEGTIVLQDPFTGEGRSLRLVVPQGAFVNSESGIVEVPESPGNALIEIVGEMSNRGIIEVVQDLTITGGPEVWQVNAGEIRIADGAVLSMGGDRFLNVDQGEWRGEISGEGTLDVSGLEFVNSATVSPGFSPGILTVVGNYEQEDGGGLLFIEISGTEPGSGYDRLVVEGEATLGGNLTVVLEGYTPELGDQFTVMTWDSRIGEFSGMLLPGLFGGLEWDAAYLADGLVLSVVDPLGDVQAVGAGRNFTCALDTGGRAYCWGVNDWGQLGSGSLGDTIPEPRRVDTEVTFTMLEAAGETVCGLTAGGEAYCWGATFAEPLNERDRVTAPAVVPGGITFQTLSLGHNHACGMDSQGVARCWGVNSNGQLGDGTQEDRPAPVPVLLGQAGEPLVTVEAGFWHSCGTNADGMPYCWGSASFGALGNGSSSGVVTEPNLVASQELFSRIEPGGVFTCGLTLEGTSHCWGHNATGQLGDGSTTNRNLPVSVAIQFPLESLALPTENSIWLHACGLTPGGDAHCWGWNQLGQLGGESSDLCTANDWDCSTMALPAAQGLTFTALAGGQAHSCGITPENELFCWGSNQFRQLGVFTEDTCQQGENDIPCAREPRRVAPQEP